MRLTITFQPLSSRAKFPLYYNYALQNFLHSYISANLVSFLHDKGYKYKKRVFKFFTFSRLMGEFKIEKNKGKIIFIGPFELYVSCPIEGFLEKFTEILKSSPELSIENNFLLVKSIKVHPAPSLSSPVFIKMLSPVTVYSPFLASSVKKKTHYYSPFEKEFSQLIQKNLLKKQIVLNGTKLTPEEFEISPVKVDKKSEKIIKYTPKRGPATIIKAWMGLYKIKAVKLHADTISKVLVSVFLMLIDPGLESQ